jgi:tyrosinase
MAGLTTRSSIESLEKQTNGLDALRDAYGKMQTLTDNRGWGHWAGVHGYPQFLCWHHNRVGNGRTTMPFDLFLPWHRAYLLYWEHTARDQNNAASLPWWDWTSAGSHSVGIPKSFVVKSVGGKKNPLASAPRPAMPGMKVGPTSRSAGNPGSLPTAAQVKQLIGLSQFNDFSDQIQDVHDQVHGWSGGDMGVVATSAFDPIFWSHHCMIDRLWYLWQLQNGVNTIPDDYKDRPLPPFGMTVRDVLDINRLGYEYTQATSIQVPVKP